MSAIMCSANFCCRKRFEAFNNSETNIKHWINKRVLFSYHQTKKGWYENMKEKNKAGRVSKKDDSYSIDCNDWYSWNRDDA